MQMHDWPWSDFFRGGPEGPLTRFPLPRYQGFAPLPAHYVAMAQLSHDAVEFSIHPPRLCN